LLTDLTIRRKTEWRIRAKDEYSTTKLENVHVSIVGSIFELCALEKMTISSASQNRDEFFESRG
jgi:hypothetical protein